MEFVAMDIHLMLKILMRLGFAVVVGAIIGGEREYKNKAAGFRTIIMICMGSTLLTSIASELNHPDPSRIMANIVTGIGFLGAGVIFKEGRSVSGITTAATIWMTAAIGMAIGCGLYEMAMISSVLVMLILILFSRIEAYIDSIQEERTYEIESSLKLENVERIEQLLKKCNLKYSEKKQSKKGNTLITIWNASGRPENHAKFVKKLFESSEFDGYSY
ncbi:MAG: MgtC/SapB family protein [Chitinophagales bacterium]|nr:MgtC/SapB family protein [Chitinophagales bacterium]